MWQYTDIDFTSHFGNVTYKGISIKSYTYNINDKFLLYIIDCKYIYICYSWINAVETLKNIRYMVTKNFFI